MKKDLEDSMSALLAEKCFLIQEIQTLNKQLRILNRIRSSEARRILAGLLPDLQKSTVQNLRQMVPEFHIPTVSSWFGLFEKVDPSVSVDDLRIKLSSHLEGSPQAIEFWQKKVGEFDEAIHDLQVNLIKENIERLHYVVNKINGIEELNTVDCCETTYGVRKDIEISL